MNELWGWAAAAVLVWFFFFSPDWSIKTNIDGNYTYGITESGDNDIIISKHNIWIRVKNGKCTESSSATISFKVTKTHIFADTKSFSSSAKCFQREKGIYFSVRDISVHEVISHFIGQDEATVFITGEGTEPFIDTFDIKGIEKVIEAI